MQLNDIRKALRFNTELVQLIETLKNIAASQYHLLEKEKERFDDFMNAFSEFFRVVNLVDVQHPLVKTSCDTLGLVIVTSDAGFMGGLNQGVIRAGLAAQGEVPDDRTALVVIGDKGASVFADRDRPFKAFKGINQEQIYESAMEVRDHIVAEVLAGRMGKVVVAYPKSHSFSSQSIQVANILPCGELFDASADSEVSHRFQGEGFVARATQVIVESSFSDMVEYLAGVWVTSKLYEVFEDSKLAEFSARAMHLEGSFQKLEKEQKKVKHQCSKATHEKIDKGMRESFSAKGGSKKRKKRVAQAAAAAAAAASAA
jgi:ATP synthase F1 gamma subunit